MKTKYDLLSKEEKKELLKKFKTTDKGIILFKSLNRLLITSICGFVFSIGFMIYTIMSKGSILDYLIYIILFIASLYFIINYFKLKKEALNNFINNKNKKA